MKKIFAFLLAAVMLTAMFVVPSMAKDDVNYKQDFGYVSTAPKINGTVSKLEYGTSKPLHSYKLDKDQFGTEDHNEYGDSWNVEFYACFDETNLYMAWVVTSDVHAGLDLDKYPNESDLGYMWMYSEVQFIITPSAPDTNNKQFGGADGDFYGSFLEGGVTLASDGNVKKIIWSTPNNAPSLTSSGWDCAIVRDDSAKTTTYEVRLPWTSTGVETIGNGAQFGLTYAVAAQENYEVKKGMIEWQSACLGSKRPDNAAVITLTGKNDWQQSEVSYSETSKAPELTEGTLPELGEDDVVLAIDTINAAITGESATLITDASKTSDKNTKWSHNILLAPVEGKANTYTIVESLAGTGEDVKFETEIASGMIVASFHSDGGENATGNERRAAAAALPVGTEVVVFGVDIAKGEAIYTNACLIAAQGEIVIPEESSEEESSEEESSEEESSEEVESSEAESSEVSKEEGGFPVWGWILIAVVVVGAIAAAVVVILKKKESEEA